ncbi:hypothetical protein [Streptomyces natalensis]|uniref:hypothetical protein n=1 Tax=Streptomyces natalensis TaxID=68242 RepID=UPI0004ABA6C4|nr:hypothetical protein [Streptomyces natalensis]
MTSLIGRTCTRLRVLFAPRGRHRAKPSAHPPRPLHAAHRAPSPLAVAKSPRRRPGPYAADIPLDGLATPLVRPYLLTRDEWRARCLRGLGVAR